jgi:hypothetical protein
MTELNWVRARGPTSAIRPVTPRRLTTANRVLFVKGDGKTIGYTNYRSRVHVLDFYT